MGISVFGSQKEGSKSSSTTHTTETTFANTDNRITSGENVFQGGDINITSIMGSQANKTTNKNTLGAGGDAAGGPVMPAITINQVDGGAQAAGLAAVMASLDHSKESTSAALSLMAGTATQGINAVSAGVMSDESKNLQSIVKYAAIVAVAIALAVVVRRRFS
jgi:hypothetical protein